MLLIGNFMQLISNWIQTCQIYQLLGGSGIPNNIQWTIKLEKTDITPEITEFCPVVKHIDISVQDCSNSIANALELLQSCTKRSISITNNPVQITQ